MESLEQLKRTVQRRFLGSFAIFAVFVVYGIVAGTSGTTFESDTLMFVLVLLVTALAVLPRTTMPRRWPAATADTEDRLDMLRDELRTLQLRATYVRITYLLTAFVVVGLLPRLGI